jgi:hypothetical protein
MAAPVCTTSALVTGCYNQELWGGKNTQLAIMVYLMAQELKGVGGTDYTGNLIGVNSSGLIAAAASLFPPLISRDQMNDAELKIYYNNAVGAGGSPGTSSAALATGIKCLFNVNPEMLRKMFLLLLCKLGHHTGSN